MQLYPLPPPPARTPVEGEHFVIKLPGFTQPYFCYYTPGEPTAPAGRYEYTVVWDKGPAYSYDFNQLLPFYWVEDE